MAPTELQPQQILDNQADMQIGFTPAYAPETVVAPTSNVGPGAAPAVSEISPLTVAEATTGLVAATNGATEKAAEDQIVTSTNGPTNDREKTVRVVGGAEVEAKDKTPKEKNRATKFLAGIALGLTLLGSMHSAEPKAKASQPAIEKVDPSEPTIAVGNEKPDSPLVKGAIDAKVLPADLERKGQLAAPEAGMLDDGRTPQEEALETAMNYGLPTARDLK